MKNFIFILSFIILSPALSYAQAPIKTSAKQAIVVDYETGAVLFDKNAQAQMPTSSMSKVMSMYLVFDALKNDAISLNDAYTVSEKAWKKGGSKMFVEVDKQIKIEDLIRGVIIQSGNDATIVLAEGLYGSEGAFADALNEKAAELGMDSSNFTNASGWPDPDHYSTAEDLSILAKALIENFPEYYKYYAEQEYTYNNITQRNRNPLLYRNIGADGIKTGHTEAGGYGLIGSGVQNGRRVIIVVNGLEDEKARAQESAKLLEWGLNKFKNQKLFTAGEAVETVSVAMSDKESIPAVVDQDLLVTLPKLAIKGVKAEAKLKEPLVAPVTKGQEVGKLEITIPNMQSIVLPLYAGEGAEGLGFFSSTITKLKLMISGDA